MRLYCMLRTSSIVARERGNGAFILYVTHIQYCSPGEGKRCVYITSYAHPVCWPSIGEMMRLYYKLRTSSFVTWNMRKSAFSM